LRVEVKEVWLRAPSGNRLYAHIHQPAEEGRYPAVVGPMTHMRINEGFPGFTADEVASHGMVVLHFDAEGVGRSEGTSDFLGPVHQDDLYAAVNQVAEMPMVDPEGIGLATSSGGVIMATGALARHPDLQDRARYLYDIEGPTNRVNLTRPFRIRPELRKARREPMAHGPLDEDYWRPREAVRFIGWIRTPYFRAQAEIDHMQLRFYDHAIELLNGATSSSWTRCNDNPPNIRYDPLHPERYRWIPGRCRDNGPLLLKYLLEVAHMTF